jgi:putative hemolysin
MSAQFDFTQAPPKIEQIKVHGSFYNQSASEKQGLVNPHLVASWARNTEEVREAQSLRYQVFGVEMGANLRTLVPGHDVDIFDDFCEHLLVRDSAFGRVIGTYRVLTPTQAKRIGGTYTDEEFDLTRLRDIRSQMVEVGRSCVHPDYRTGGVILSLWRALTQFMRSNNLHIMIGCGTIPLRRTSIHNEPFGGDIAASVWAKVESTRLAPIERRVIPRTPLPLERFAVDSTIEAPALINAYFRMGAKVMGPPAWDADFNAADLPLIFDLNELPVRYKRLLSS